MSTETQERAGRESTGLPSGVRKRQSWRPPAVRVLETLVSRLMRHAEPFVSNAAERLAWYEQFIQRVRPWQGWLPMSLEFPTKEQTSEGQIQETPAISMVSYRNGSDATNETSPPLIQRYAAPAAPTIGLTTAQQSRAKPALSRPAIGLAILRTVQTTQTTSGMDAGSHDESPPVTRDHNSWHWLSIADVSKSEPHLVTGISSTPRQVMSGGFPMHQPSHPVLPEALRTGAEQEASPFMPWMATREVSLATGPAILRTIQTTKAISGMDAGSHNEFPRVTRDHNSWRWLSIADVSKSEPRLVTGASSTPRQEVRSGFPIHQPSHPVLPEPSRTRTEPETSPLMQWTKTREASTASPSKSESRGAIETLLEQTVMPVPLPGLELRLVSPGEEDSSTHALQHADGDRQPAADNSTPPMHVPASPPRPELDINEVAEKVYNTLVRRQQIERERLGLY